MKKLENQDPLLVEALDLFIKENRVSISLLQRVFVIGYPRAARIVDQLEELGLVSCGEYGENRQLLITEEEFKSLNLE